MATHSSIFAWKIPLMEEPGRIQSMGSQRAGHDWATSLTCTEKNVSLSHKLCRFLLLSFPRLWKLETNSFIVQSKKTGWEERPFSRVIGTDSLYFWLICLFFTPNVYSSAYKGDEWGRECVLSHFSCVWLFATPWTEAHQVPLPMDFPGKDTGVGCHSYSRGSSWPRYRSMPLMSPALAGRFITSSATWDARSTVSPQTLILVAHSHEFYKLQHLIG